MDVEIIGDVLGGSTSIMAVPVVSFTIHVTLPTRPPEATLEVVERMGNIREVKNMG